MVLRPNCLGTCLHTYTDRDRVRIVKVRKSIFSSVYELRKSKKILGRQNNRYGEIETLKRVTGK